MDERQGDGADALDLYDNVAVVADPTDATPVAGEGAPGDTHGVALAEIVLAVDLAPVGALGGQKAHQPYLALAYGLDAGAGDVTVDAERDQPAVGTLAHGLEGQGTGLGNAHEHKAGNDGADADMAVGTADGLPGEVDRLAQRLQTALGLEYPASFYRIPVLGILHKYPSALSLEDILISPP